MKNIRRSGHLSAVIFFLLGQFLVIQTLVGQDIDPDDTREGRLYLETVQEELSAESARQKTASRMHQMLAVGLWDEVGLVLAEEERSDAEWQLVQVRYEILQNRFFKADSLLQSLLAAVPDHVEARWYRSELEIQAWRLGQAERTCLDLLKENPRHEAAVLQLGRVYMLQKQYPRALSLAEQVIQWNPGNDQAHQLAAEVYLWLRQEDKAEKALKDCLRLNPLNADARFYYGYAIWRRVDATQLPDMAAQWELALSLHPLHYLTHWHWGNGHTHLTFADYLDPDEAEVLDALRAVDSLIQVNEMDAAVQLAGRVGDTYFASVIPDMMQASALYMAYDQPLEQRLDAAQQIFLDILRKKPHYGPAHNGLAAVIKQKRFPYLANYDSLEQVIVDTEITDPENFYQVFPDMDYYPGDRVQKMVWNQLYASVVYFPFLSKQNRQFVIPPLHVDLATAMKNPYFRGATTFDNRQWMDIRGVGSGATAIEYVERGAHQERNVTLHEYVHLFHGSVFTDEENRRVRALYYSAMENDLTLDYYSANNESEYLAQTYTAYFIPVKVHPLNHKSVNTTGDLRRKDPALYAFLDSLVAKQRAYLSGDSMAMADNWAEVYVNLAQKEESPARERAYLDTALMWDSTYLPAQLEYARSLIKGRSFGQARKWLEKAQSINPRYGPIYTAYAELSQKKFELGQADAETTISEIEAYFEQAMRYENDYAIRARFSQRYRDYLKRYVRWQEAIEVAERYATTATGISTYLRDRKDEAAAFAWEMKGTLGYAEEAIAFFQELSARKPQHYPHRNQYARILMANERWEEAAEVLAEAQTILEAAGTPDAQFYVLMALCYLELGETKKAEISLENLWELNEPTRLEMATDLVQIHLKKGDLEQAEDAFHLVRFPKEPAGQAEYHFLQGLLSQSKGDSLRAESEFRTSLDLNLYHLPARLALLEILDQRGERRQVKRIASRGMVLPMPPGPVAMAKLEAYLN
jgi:tetratricopeptide (TPR) repeat protein